MKDDYKNRLVFIGCIIIIAISQGPAVVCPRLVVNGRNTLRESEINKLADALPSNLNYLLCDPDDDGDDDDVDVRCVRAQSVISKQYRLKDNLSELTPLRPDCRLFTGPHRSALKIYAVTNGMSPRVPWT